VDTQIGRPASQPAIAAEMACKQRLGAKKLAVFHSGGI
jgi:hypothetical protein